MSSVISSLTFYYLEIKDRLGRLKKLQTQPLRRKFVGYFKSSAARASPRSHRLRQRGQSALATQLRPSSPIAVHAARAVTAGSPSRDPLLRGPRNRRHRQPARTLPLHVHHVDCAVSPCLSKVLSDEYRVPPLAAA